MDVKNEVVTAVREALRGGSRDVAGLLGGFLISAILLAGLTTGVYYFASGGKMQPALLIGLILAVLTVAWLIGALIGSSTAVGPLSEGMYKTSRRTYWLEEGLSSDLAFLSFLLPVLQFFCGSLYGATTELFRSPVSDRLILVSGAVVEAALERSGLTPSDLFSQLSHHGLSSAEFDQALRLLLSKGLLEGGRSIRVADALRARCR